MRPLACLPALVCAAMLIAGCTPGEDDPAAVVERYLQAKIESDAQTIQQLLCAEMEDRLELEAHTFDTVTGVSIEGMACSREGDDTVTCDGVIVARYGTEQTEFSLSTYRVVREDAGWKWCGEA